MRRYSAPPKLPDSCIAGSLGIAQNRHAEPVGAVIEPQLLRQKAHAVEDLRFAFLLGKDGRLVSSTLAGGAKWFVIIPLSVLQVDNTTAKHSTIRLSPPTHSQLDVTCCQRLSVTGFCLNERAMERLYSQS